VTSTPTIPSRPSQKWAHVAQGYLLLALILACPGALAAQGSSARKIGVSVEHTGTDTVGVRFAFAVREAIRRSAGYTLISESPDYAVVILMLSTDASVSTRGDLQERNKGDASFVSVSHLVEQPAGRRYLTSALVAVGSAATESMAQSVLAQLDAALAARPQLDRVLRTQ
jgi:hypothetical protein